MPGPQLIPPPAARSRGKGLPETSAQSNQKQPPVRFRTGGCAVMQLSALPPHGRPWDHSRGTFRGAFCRAQRRGGRARQLRNKSIRNGCRSGRQRSEIAEAAVFRSGNGWHHSCTSTQAGKPMRNIRRDKNEGIQWLTLAAEQGRGHRGHLQPRHGWR